MSAMKKMIGVVAVAVVLFVTGAGVMAGPIYVESFGSRGIGTGQFNNPKGIAVDAAGNLYVADSDNYRIVKLTQAGGSVSWEWSYGTFGTGNGQFYPPNGVAVDSAGAVYVADNGNSRIQKLSQSGGGVSWEWSYGTNGTGNGQFRALQGIAVDSVGNVYVADAGNERIQKLSQSGGGVSWEWSYGTFGTGNGQFYSPNGVAVDSAGAVYVADWNNDRIVKLTQAGGSVSWEWSYGSHGSGEGQLLQPYEIAVSTGGALYVSDGRNNRIVKLTQAGGSVSWEWSLGTLGAGNGQFNNPNDVAVDAAGNLYVVDTDNHRIQRWFDSEAVAPGGTMNIANLVVHFGNVLLVTGNRRLDVTGRVVIEAGASLNVEQGTVSGGVIEINHGGPVYVAGSISSQLASDATSELHATGDAELGDATRYNGFTYEGQMYVGANHVTLRSKGMAALGVVTEISGGTLAAPNGVVIGPGRALAGSGTVAAKVSAGFGSTIEATGALSLGDAAAYDGFYSDGTLLTGRNAVTIYDRNAAVLGSLTQLGDGSAGGTLTAGRASPGDTQAHLLLEQGKNMVGRGSVNGNFKNHGDVIGDGVAAGERVIFNSPWIVSGKGTFTNTLIMGTFAPGESPGITNGTNQGFGGAVQIELGGTVPGFGNGNHDQINDTGTILLVGSPTLEILPWNGFVPEIGDEFIILTWQAGLDGLFGNVVTDSWFTDRDISFALHYNNIGGAGNLTIEAIPEPATLSLLALLALSLPKRGGLAMIRRRRK